MTHVPNGLTVGRRTRAGARLVASVVALSAGLAAMAAGAAPSRADDDPWVTVPPAGWTMAWDWMATGPNQLSGALPGNLAEFGAATHRGESRLAAFAVPEVANRTRFQASAVTDLQTCTGSSTVGAKRACGDSYTTTLTFPRPIANPLVSFRTGDSWASAGIGTEPPWALRSGVDSGVLEVNHVVPRAGQVEALNLRQATFDSSRNVVTADAAALVPQGPAWLPEFPAGSAHQPYGLLQVHGLVSSVTLSHDQYAIVIVNAFGGSADASYFSDAPVFATGTLVSTSDLSVTTSAPARVPAGETLTWTVAVANEGPGGSHGFTVRDAVPAGISDVRLVSGPPGCALVGAELRCAAAPAGWNVARDAMVPTFANLTGGDAAASVPEVLAAGASWEPIVLEGRVTAPAGTTLSSTATVAGADADTNTANNTARASTEVTAAWGVTKTSTPAAGTVLAPGSTVDYQVLATSTSGQVDGVVLTDDLSDVLDDAAFVPGSAALSIDDGPLLPVADPTGTLLSTPAFTLPAGTSAVLTYRVTVDEAAWSSSLRNTVTGTGPVPPATCADPAAPEPVCRTVNDTFSRVVVTKKGTDSTGTISQLAGAEFTLHTDDDGAPGTVVDPGPVAVPGLVGTVEARNLTPGSYWLTETRAPAGHTLLAEPVAFAIATDGTVALVDPAAHPQVTATAHRIEILDVRALTLPSAGATGHGTALITAGAALLLTALVAALRTSTMRRSPRGPAA